MAKLGIFAAVILAAAGASCEVEAWAADVVPPGGFCGNGSFRTQAVHQPLGLY